MRYFLIERQSGGCDYTIGCGIQVSELQVKSVEEAIETSANEIGFNWQGRNERAINKAELLIVDSVVDLKPYLDKYKQDLIEKQKNQESLEHEASERKLYEKLKSKYEK